MINYTIYSFTFYSYLVLKPSPARTCTWEYETPANPLFRESSLYCDITSNPCPTTIFILANFSVYFLWQESPSEMFWKMLLSEVSWGLRKSVSIKNQCTILCREVIFHLHLRFHFVCHIAITFRTKCVALISIFRMTFITFRRSWQYRPQETMLNFYNNDWSAWMNKD